MVYGGKTHVLLPCCFATLSYPTFFNLFNVLLGGWAVMAAGGWAVIAFGSGVAGLSVLFPHPHSTHDPMLALPVLFSLTHSSLACSSPSRGAIVVLFTRRKFSLTRGRFSLLIRAPFWLCAHPRAYAELFSLTQGSSPIFLTHRPLCCRFSRSWERSCLSVVIHDFHRAESGMFSPAFCGLV